MAMTVNCNHGIYKEKWPQKSALPARGIQLLLVCPLRRLTVDRPPANLILDRALLHSGHVHGHLEAGMAARSLRQETN